MKQLATSRIVRYIEVKVTQPQAHTLTEAQATSRIVRHIEVKLTQPQAHTLT